MHTVRQRMRTMFHSNELWKRIMATSSQVEFGLRCVVLHVVLDQQPIHAVCCEAAKDLSTKGSMVCIGRTHGEHDRKHFCCPHCAPPLPVTHHGGTCNGAINHECNNCACSSNVHVCSRRGHCDVCYSGVSWIVYL